MRAERLGAMLRWGIGGLLGLGLAVATVQTASAAVLRVGDECANITGCLTAATPGDTVVLRPGVYTENVVVDTPRLTIVGQRAFNRGNCSRPPLDAHLNPTGPDPREQVIVDGTPAGEPGNGFTVNADDVKIVCLMIRNTATGIQVNGHRFTADRVKVERSFNFNIVVGRDDDIGADNYTIRGSNLGGGRRGNLIAVGNDGKLLDSFASQAGGPCFRLRGARLLLQNNVATNCRGSGGVLDQDQADGFFVSGEARGCSVTGPTAWTGTASISSARGTAGVD